MRMARRRGWASDDFTGPAVLALALAAYAGTLWLLGNVFVAAFVAGLAFGNVAGRGGVKEVFYVEQTAGLVSLLTWLIFGAVAVPIVVEHADWQVLGYAVLSLTVVRSCQCGLPCSAPGCRRGPSHSSDGSGRAVWPRSSSRCSPSRSSTPRPTVP
jgi:hypothetical protein